MLSQAYEFSASTRTSGVKISKATSFMLPQGGPERGRFRRKSSRDDMTGSDVAPEAEVEIIKGSPDAVKAKVASVPSNVDSVVDGISSVGVRRR